VNDLMDEIIQLGACRSCAAWLFHDAPPILLDLRPEVMGMRLHSVMAAVGFAHHDGEQLAKGT
jgi:hypothetical protein